MASLETRPTRPSSAAEHGVVHGLRLQALGGVELEPAVDAQHVDGADLRHHVGGDQHHDLVEAFLRADRLRHHFAKPSQQHARTAERATHGVILGAGRSRAAPALLSQEIAPAGPVTRGHISPQAIANAPCKPQAKGRGGRLGRCHGFGTIPWSLIADQKGMCRAPDAGTGDSGGGGNRRGRAAHLRFGRRGQCRRGPSGAETVRPSPDSGPRAKQPGDWPPQSNWRYMPEHLPRLLYEKQRAAGCEAISGPRTRSRNCSIHAATFGRQRHRAYEPARAMLCARSAPPPAERDAQRDGRNPGRRGPNV